MLVVFKKKLLQLLHCPRNKKLILNNECESALDTPE